MGDFNSHNRLWNCNFSDKKGKILLEEMSQRMNIVNDKTESHVGSIIQSEQYKYRCSVCFLKDVMANKKCEQGEDLWGSGH